MRSRAAVEVRQRAEERNWNEEGWRKDDARCGADRRCPQHVFQCCSMPHKKAPYKCHMTYLVTFFLAYLPGISFDIISFWHSISYIFADLFVIEVRRRTLWSAACGGGLAGRKTRIQKCDLESRACCWGPARSGGRKKEGGRRKEGGCRQADIKSKHLWCGQALSAKWCSMLSPTPAAKRFWHELWKFGLSSLVVEANRAESWINLLSI